MPFVLCAVTASGMDTEPDPQEVGTVALLQDPAFYEFRHGAPAIRIDSAAL